MNDHPVFANSFGVAICLACGKFARLFRPVFAVKPLEGEKENKFHRKWAQRSQGIWRR